MASKSEKYLSAMRDVRENKMSGRAAAKKWGVTRSSLNDRLNGKLEYYRRSGPPPVLTKEEESHLAEWIVEMKQRGCGFTKNDIFDYVKKMLDENQRETPFMDNRPGNKWFRGFVTRNKNVRLKGVLPSEKKRTKTSTSDANGQRLIQEHNLADRPIQIWKCIETCFDLQGRQGKIIGISENPPTATKDRLTLVTCFNASGQWIPPYIIIPGKRVPKTYNPLEGGVPGSAFSVTENGTMDASAFNLWLHDHFIPNIPPRRPVGLLVDSRNSHISPEAFELAKNSCIEIFGCTDSTCDMADDSFSCVIKKTWDKHEGKYMRRNPNCDITKKNFCFVFRSAFEDVMRPRILIDAFHQSGWYPLDKTPVSDDHTETDAAVSCALSSLVTVATSEVVSVVEIDSAMSETVPRASSGQN